MRQGSLTGAYTFLIILCYGIFVFFFSFFLKLCIFPFPFFHLIRERGYVYIRESQEYNANVIINVIMRDDIDRSEGNKRYEIGRNEESFVG